jgi:predicted peptidase
MVALLIVCLFGGCKKDDNGDPPVMQQEIYNASSLNYLLFMPRETKTQVGGKLPLIISLHGIGERGSDLWQLKRDGLPKILDGYNSFPFIVVSPQCPSTTEWYYHDGVDTLVNKLLDTVIARYPVDTNRVYLTGYSMGGIGTLYFAVRYPARFAALVPIAFRIESGWDVCALKNIPVWAFHGAKDDVIPLESAQSVVTTLVGCGGNPKFTVYPDANHDSWTRTYSNPEVFTWMLGQKRQ